MDTYPSPPSPISSLPVELFRSILQLVLGVPKHLLSKPHARFGRRKQSSAEYLLVCKLWLAIGTPLLYEAVILRSAAQVHALRATLSEYPGRGLLVRSLRIEEGAYRMGIRQAAEHMPHVKTLVLSLAVYNSTNAPASISRQNCGRRKQDPHERSYNGRSV